MSDTITIDGSKLKKCSKCGIFKDESSFHASTNDATGLQNYCKRCAKQYKNENQPTFNSASKAMSPVERLAWLDDRIPNQVKQQVTALLRGDPVAVAKAHQRSDLIAKSFTTMAKATRREFAKQREELAKQRLVDLIEQTVVKAKASRKLAKAKAVRGQAIADQAAAEHRLRKSANELQRLQAQQADKIREANVIRSRVEAMTDRLEAGLKAVREVEERRAAAIAARQQRESDDWTAKAMATNDPILREGYLLAAEGKENDDND